MAVTSAGPVLRLAVPLRSEVRAITRAGPERWLYVVAGLGWAVLIGHAALGILPSGASGMSGAAMSGHDMAAMDPDRPMASGAGTAGPHAGLVFGVVVWVAMLAATMLPLLADSVRFVALRSPRRRRSAATLDVVAGWALAWLLGASAIALGSELLASVLGPTGVVVVVFAVAAGWQSTRLHRSAVVRCHRTFAPALEPRRARAGCCRFGLQLGADCVVSCWALMAAMHVSGHGLGVVVSLAWVSWFERRRPHRDPRTRTTTAVVVATGVATVAMVALA